MLRGVTRLRKSLRVGTTPTMGSWVYAHRHEPEWLKDRKRAQSDTRDADVAQCHVCGAPSLYRRTWPTPKGACAQHREALRPA